MKDLVVAALNYVGQLKFIEGYRTQLGAVGLFGAGLAKLFTEPADVPGAVGLFAAGLAALGVRYAK